MNLALKIIGLIIGAPIAVFLVSAVAYGLFKDVNWRREEAWVKNVRNLPTFDACYRDAQGYGASLKSAYDICQPLIRGR